MTSMKSVMKLITSPNLAFPFLVTRVFDHQMCPIY